MKAAQCAATYGSHCIPQGKLINPGPAGTDCTNNRSPGLHSGAYCYCKFIYVPPPKPTDKFNPNEILQQREEAVIPLPTPTFDPTEMLQWTRDVKERADTVVHSRPLVRPTFNPNDFLQWTRNNKKRSDLDQEGYPLPTPTFDPTEILQWTRDVKENSEVEHEARDGHIENLRQLPTSAINEASSSIAGALSSALLGLTSTSMPITTMMSATSKSSAWLTSTVTPVLPQKSGAVGRQVTGVLSLLGTLAVGFVAAL